MTRAHFLFLAVGIALSTAFVPACGPAPQAPGRVSWAEQPVQKAHNVSVSRLHTSGRVSWAEQLARRVAVNNS